MVQDIFRYYNDAVSLSAVRCMGIFVYKHNVFLQTIFESLSCEPSVHLYMVASWDGTALCTDGLCQEILWLPVDIPHKETYKGPVKRNFIFFDDIRLLNKLAGDLRHDDHVTSLIFRQRMKYSLTNWGRLTHICVSKLSIIVSDNGLSPDRRQAIIWTNLKYC